jgi:hypothetical protein
MTQQLQAIDGPARPENATVPNIRAVVHTGATETAYRRAGSGPPVLLLLGDGPDSPRAIALIEALAGSCRVIAPESPEPAYSAHARRRSGGHAVWLRDLMDGLGLVRPCIIADDRFALSALAFTLADPHRAGRLLIATGSQVLDASAGLALEEVVGAGATPILILQLEEDEELIGGSSAVLQMMTFVHCALVDRGA